MQIPHTTKFTSALLIPWNLLAASKQLLTSPKLLLFIIPPYLIGITTGIISLKFSFPVISNYLTESFELSVRSFPVWINIGLNYLTTFFAYSLTLLASGLFSILIAFLSMNILTGFFIESFLKEAIHLNNLSSPIEIGFLKSFLRGIKEELRKFVLIFFLILIIFITSFIPILIPISILLSFFLIGFQIFELPLLMLGNEFIPRVRKLLNHWPEVLAMGAIFTLFSIIPFLGVILLPVGYLASIKQSSKWQEKSVIPQNLLHLILLKSTHEGKF